MQDFICGKNERLNSEDKDKGQRMSIANLRVKTATSLGRSGLQDWLIQRVTAIILALYTIFILGYILQQHYFYYHDWANLFKNEWMRYATLIVLISLIAHAWVGVWTIITDYLKPVILRFVVQVIVILALLGYLMWGIQILWRL